MFNHVHFLLIGCTIGMTALTSCQPLSESVDNRFTTNRRPIEVSPSVRTHGAELFARNPLVEFQTTGANPAPIRSLSAGEPLTILRADGRFTEVRLMDGTIGYINSNEIQQGSSGYSGGNRVPDQYGNRFGGGTRPDNVMPPIDNSNTDPSTPTSPTTPTTPEPDLIDLDNF